MTPTGFLRAYIDAGRQDWGDLERSIDAVLAEVATIDLLQTTIKAFNNGMPAMTTKEVADENAELRAHIDRLTKERDEARAQFDNHVVWASGQAAELEAKVARLTKGRDSFAASYTHAAEERDEAITRLSAVQEAIDEAVRRAHGDGMEERPWGCLPGMWVAEPLRPFATKPNTPSARIMSDKDRENPVEGAHPATKPEPEVDPLVAALREVLPTHTCEVGKLWAANLRTALAARGGRVVFDGREG